jgi:dienelactone hydrolase
LLVVGTSIAAGSRQIDRRRYHLAVRWGEDVVSRGVRERSFIADRDGHEIPGLLWTPEDLGEPLRPNEPGSAGLKRSDAVEADPPDRASPVVPLVLIGHGGSGNKREPYVVSLARRFTRHHGFAAAAIDGPVHGDRRGSRDRSAALTVLDFSQRWASDPSMTDEMVADWRSVLDALQSVDGIGGGAVGWWGLSMGTILGLPLVAAERRISVAVLGLMGLTGPTRDRLERDAPDVKCPVLFLVQTYDELFPRATALELFDSIGSDDKRLHAHPGAHGAVPVEALRASEAFIAEHLTQPSRR